MFNLLNTVNGTALNSTISAVASRIEKIFGLNSFVLSQHNNAKRAREIKVGGKPANLPYGFMKLGNIEFVNRMNAKHIARVGSGQTSDWETATLSLFHYFPVNISADCECRFAELSQATLFAEALFIALLTAQLQFELSISGDKWTVTIDSGSGGTACTVPFPVLEDVDNPNGIYFSVPFSVVIGSKIGFSRDVAKFNNYGRVDIRGEIQNVNIFDEINVTRGNDGNPSKT